MEKGFQHRWNIRDGNVHIWSVYNFKMLILVIGFDRHLFQNKSSCYILQTNLGQGTDTVLRIWSFVRETFEKIEDKTLVM
jgi:hypothetical protein